MERHMIRSGSLVLITKVENGKEFVLLQKRYKTGFCDNQFDLTGGHVDKGETNRFAAVRETREEINLSINEEDLQFVCAINAKFDDAEYVFMAFHALKYTGVPVINEKNKCSKLKWFIIDDLPKDITSYSKMIIENYKNQVTYSTLNF